MKSAQITQSSNAGKMGDRKNSSGQNGVVGEVSSAHAIGRSTGVRGSVELKSIS